jgi:hypothetical protein
MRGRTTTPGAEATRARVTFEQNRADPAAGARSARQVHRPQGIETAMRSIRCPIAAAPCMAEPTPVLAEPAPVNYGKFA